MKKSKSVLLLLITLILSSCGSILDQCPPITGDTGLYFSVLDKSTKEDLLDPKSDNPKAIDFAKAQVLFYYGKSFVKADNNTTNLRVTLNNKEDGNSPGNKLYTVNFTSINNEGYKSNKVFYGTTVFKWSKTNIDTIKTESKYIKAKRDNLCDILKTLKVWVNGDLVSNITKGGTTDRKGAINYFVLYK